MSSSGGAASGASHPQPTELALALATRLKSSPASLETASRLLFDDLVDEIALGVAFETHRSARTGLLPLLEVPAPSPSKSSASTASSSGYATDVFGSVVQTSSGVPALKKQPECTCPNCQRNMAASRFAPHLEKCMGMGRNSSRLASRRLATIGSKAGMHNDGDPDDNEAPGDEDWCEPGPAAGSGGRIHHRIAEDMAGPGSSSGLYHGPGRRKRDRNSPRRTKGRNKNNGGQTSSGEPSSHEGSAGTITPPTDLDLLSHEERAYWLAAICGVMSVTSRKICSRSTRCPVHSDAQRKEVRLKWLGGGQPGVSAGHKSSAVGEDDFHDPLQPEDTHVDIDSFTEGDTAALRESLAQLSGASSPAESVVSTTSSNPSSSISGAQQQGGRGRGDKRGGRGGRGGKKGGRQPGSKGGSRGSTPPLMMLD